MLNLISICESPNKLEIIRIIKLIIDIIRITIPLIIIISSLYKFLRYFIKLWDFEVQNTFKKVLTNSVISLLVYFVPLIITFGINLKFPEYKDCVNVNLNIIENLYVKQLDEYIDKLDSNPNYDDIDSARKIASNIRNDELKKEYNDKLDNIEKIVNSKVDFKNNYGGNIYMGDSRTVALSDVLYDNEQMVAKNGAKLNDFLEHIQTAKEILNNNKDKSYNIILNYGVNDTQDVYGYCAAYTNFIKDIKDTNRIYLVSVNPVNDETKKRETSKVLEFNDIIKSCMSNIDNLTYCDVYNTTSHEEWIDKYLKSDGLHYNSDGNEYIHSQVLSCIK
ncbi:MAG: SGNH/GDSL hydrolase family protein [Bacilli bacterium]